MDMAMIFAHADDEIISCGGTIARCNIEGHNIHVIILTESCSAGHLENISSGPQGSVVEEISEKRREFLAAAEVVGGYASWEMCEFPDMRLDTVPHVDINRAIERFINKVRPEIVFTHNSGDINKDHQLVYESVQVATRPVPGSPVKKVLCCESMYNNAWNGQPFVPNTYVDISDTLNIKLEAMEQYRSELREFPHPRSARSIINHACSRGAEVGIGACEAFIMIKNIV